MLKKSLSLLLLSIFLLTSGLGCKGLTPAQKAAVKPITLNYWTVYDNMDQLRQFAKDYQIIRSYVTVNVRQVRYEEFNNLFLTALADDVAPDIISINVRNLRDQLPRLAEMPANVNVSRVYVSGQYVKETVVEAVNQAMPTINNIKKDYVSTVQNDVVVAGKIYGLPLAIDTMALYYNVDMLDKAGVAQPPQTWEEFTNAVKKITKYDAKGAITQSGVALGTGTNIDNVSDILALLLGQNGITMEENGRVRFAEGLDKNAESHPAMQVSRFYSDFADPTKAVYSWNDKMPKALDSFANGQTAFYFGFAFDLPRLKARAPQMNLAVLPIPQLSDTTSFNVASYWIESVVKKSKHPNEAWDFVRFITSPENVKKYTTAVTQPSPFRAQLASQAENVDLAPFTRDVLTAKNWYHGKNFQAANTALANMIAGFLLPAGERETQTEHDANLIIRAAQTVQQTY